jgi:GH43 family beta-xylosidase
VGSAHTANTVAGSGPKARPTAQIPGADTGPTPAPNADAPGRIIYSGTDDATDPFMLTIDGRYYLYTSEGETLENVPLLVATRLGHWAAPIDVLPQLPAWAAGGLTWAPDVQKVRGGWALYFTALVSGVHPFTHCIGSAFSSSPRGPFVASPKPFICQLDHRGSIDARVVTEGHNLVMLWKSDDNANPSVPGPDQGGYTGIYAQNLSADGKTLLGAPVRILSPSQRWEGTIVESPDMIEAWGVYWLFFSANWYDSTLYGIGVAACETPLGPCADTDTEPFLGSNLQGLGPGESSLFEDGDAIYVLYNPFKANDPGPVIPRPVSMARIGFTPYGPYLALP